MKSNYEFKEIDIKNRTCYYFDDMIETEDFDFDNFLIDEKSYENIFVYNISCKILIGAKPLRISFNKVHRFIRVYDGTRYLVLLTLKTFGDIEIEENKFYRYKSPIF